MRVCLIVGLAALTLAWPVNGQYVVQTNVSGGLLAQICGTDRDLQIDPCNGFILGVADGLAIGGQICPPTESWSLIAPRVVRKFIKDNPAALSTSGGMVVYQALKPKYPCKAKRGK